MEQKHIVLNYFLSPPKAIFSLLLEREGTERERETAIGCVIIYALGLEPATQVHALTENGTSDPVVHRTTLQLTEPHRPELTY